MSALVLPLSYLGWHYTLALRDLAGICRNLLWFVYHFFSLPTLARTLFAPWRRLGESYPKDTFDIGGKLAALFINSLMRLIGAVIRLWMLLLGWLIWIIAALLAVLGFLLWLALPVLLVIAFFIALSLIFT